MDGTGASVALIWCPFPNRESARAIAGQLLDARLVACGNIIGDIESHFVWQGGRDTAVETGVLFKTTAALLPHVVEQLGKLHPYDTPAIIGWCADAALPATIAWLNAATHSQA